ncbi:TPA: bacteriocin secretion accessory protein [Streptococcus equi subsp. zooepidemicus]|nr:bacteriocin secretion accessory protein [Streptococcus equi subsp. zooepidemicus]HEL0627703.1 bacteriocin secretion accessory protein [Streptococcus equi subsp. zooepidemicus]HEL0724442.1 bacteriocin secretion accessory protein [Streptococcus equi subsp. zooepidemicus]
MNPNMFKSAEFYQRRYHHLTTFLTIPLALLLAFLILFSCFAYKEITVTSYGEITPTQVIATVQSISNNPIVANHLINNQPIKQGDSIIQYAKDLEESQKQVLEKQLATYEKQKSSLNTLLLSLKQGQNLFQNDDQFGYVNTFNHFMSQAQDIDLGFSKIKAETSQQAQLIQDSIVAINQQINGISQQIADYEELRAAVINQSNSLSSNNPHQATLDAYLSQSQTDQEAATNQLLFQIDQSLLSLKASMDSLNKQRANLHQSTSYDNSLNTKLEILRTQFLITASQQLTDVSHHITELKAQLEQATLQVNSLVIKAPKSGIVHLNSAFEGKTSIPIGHDIAYIYPSLKQTKQALLTYYVSSESVSLLKKNQIVRLALDRHGNQPIVITGTIKTIDELATKTKQGNLFKVTAKLTLSKKESTTIQYGQQGRVISVIAQKTFFDFYKDKLFKVTE